MALFFNIDNLERIAKRDPSQLVQVLENFYKGSPPKKNKYSTLPQYNRKDLFGDSFILNPGELLASKHDPAYVAQYIRLAARRSYLLYKLYKFTGLDLRLYPDIDISKIKHNPLLKIVNSTIYFKFEDK